MEEKKSKWNKRKLRNHTNDKGRQNITVQELYTQDDKCCYDNNTEHGSASSEDEHNSQVASYLRECQDINIVHNFSEPGVECCREEERQQQPFLNQNIFILNDEATVRVCSQIPV